jgi:hypothetical protein
MRNFRTGFVCFLAALAVAFVAGCGQETVTIPGVVSVTPAQGAVGVAINTPVTATFSMAMDSATITASTFTLAGPGGAAVAGAVSYNGVIATFTPAANLANGTTYTATVTNGAATHGGAELVGNYAWSFTTVAAIVPPVPIVMSVTPLPFATNVVLNAPIGATFSMAMNGDSIGAATFMVAVPGGATIAGSVTLDGTNTVATFTPAGGTLAYSTTYTATITTGAMSAGNVPLASNYVWTFTTISPPPVVIPPPTVVSTIPVSTPEDMNVPLNQKVSAAFSEPMDSTTIIGANFTLTGPGVTPVSGVVSYAPIGNTLVFSPSANLLPNTTYTATITTGVTNQAGTAMVNPYVWTFMTGTTLDATPPELVKTVPGDTAPGVQAIDVPLNQAVSATFSKAMNPLNLNTATFLLYEGTSASGTPIAAKITYDPVSFIATLTPTKPLTASTTYTATVTNEATDLAGNPLGNTVPSPYTNPWTFTTGTAALPPPIVLGATISTFGGLGGGAGITNQGIHTVVNGNIATTGTSTTITGFHDTSLAEVGAVWPCSYTETTLNAGQVNGVIDTAAPPPTVDCLDEGTAATFAIASQAALEARTAYTTLQAIPPGILLATNELGNRTLAPGTYTSASFYQITTGPLTLDAQGDPNATWVFQMGSYFTVGTPTASESVVLINGAKAGNVYWAVGGLPGAVINYGGGGTMVGTIISQPGITISSPGVDAVTTLNGRVLALDASTTMVNTVINVP